MNKKEIMKMVKDTLRRWHEEMADTLVLTTGDRAEAVEIFGFEKAIRMFLNNNVKELKEVDEDCLSFILNEKSYCLEIM